MLQRKLGHQHEVDDGTGFRFHSNSSNLVCHCILFVLGISIGTIATFHVSNHLSVFNQQYTSFFSINSTNDSRRGSIFPYHNFSSFLPSSYEEIQSQDKNSSAIHENKTCRGSTGEAKTMIGLKEWIEPHNLMHNMTDDELLWRASMVPNYGGYPYKRVPKVAFLFLTRGPLPLAPLWERFFKGHEAKDKHSIYIHTHPSYKEPVSEQSVFSGRQIPSREVGWGSISMTQAERRLIANALLDFSNEWFVLLSEACIPVSNFSTVYEYLMNSIESYVDIEDPTDSAKSRYNKNMAPVIMIEQWRKGSTWFQVDRRTAVGMISDQIYFPLFAQYTVCSDEHYFQTLIHIKFSTWCANRTLTYVDWSRHWSHPESFGGSDVTVDLLRKMRSGKGCKYGQHEASLCNLFARKFRPDSLGALLNLTSQDLGF